jgi:hypothetical protein
LPSTNLTWAEDYTGSYNRASIGPKVEVSSLPSQANVDLSRIHIADFTGDGLPDILYVNSGQIPSTLHINQGGTSFKSATGATPTFDVSFTPSVEKIDLSRIHVLDINGDGVSDILVVKTNTSSQIYLSSGSTGSGSPFTTAARLGPIFPISTDPTMANIDLRCVQRFLDFSQLKLPQPTETLLLGEVTDWRSQCCGDCDCATFASFWYLAQFAN